VNVITTKNKHQPPRKSFLFFLRGMGVFPVESLNTACFFVYILKITNDKGFENQQNIKAKQYLWEWDK